MERLPRWVLVALFSVLVISALALLDRQQPARPLAAEISYTEFKSLVAKGSVLDVTLRGSKVEATLREPATIGSAKSPTDRITTLIPAIGDPALLAQLEDKNVVVRSAEDQTEAIQPLLGLIPWLLLIAFYVWIWRRMSQGIVGGFGRRGEIGRFLEGPVRAENTRPRVTFADVAGQDNAKREVAELVDYLRNPERYTRLGAEVPHGILLMGPPGTGKTLLARALAGEAEVPFFSISASEFIEVFVGVGASRVRRMFDQAKERAPSIIFIDELDAVGRVRGTGLGGGHDEREQTLNQILAEMDGFAGHEAVIVLAATNRPDVLDPALLRPGRFDRHVTLDLPDRKARVEILKVHVRKVPLAPDVQLEEVAAGTPGFSGADLRNLVNEAAMAAARDNADRVSKRHFDDMRDRLLLGAARTLAIQPDERHRMAVHEAGHTIVACQLPHADPVQKVTIIPRGRSLGATQQLPEEDRHTLPEEYLRDRLCILLAGRAAEKQFLQSVSSGADDDIRQATALARAMVTRWGMSEEIGPVDVRESDEYPFLGREIALPRRFSETVANSVDEAVRHMLREAEQQAADIIEKSRAAMARLIATLEDRETLERREIDACLTAVDTPRQLRLGS